MTDPIPESVSDRVEWAKRHLHDSPAMLAFCKGILDGAEGAVDSPFRGLQAIGFIALMNEASTGQMTLVEIITYMLADFARWVAENDMRIDDSNAELLAIQYMFWTD